MSKIRELLEQEKLVIKGGNNLYSLIEVKHLEAFSVLIVNECIKEIESYQISPGNSPLGELASEWTYDALANIRDNIRVNFGIE